MKQRVRILLDDLQIQDVIKGPIIVGENGVVIDVERVIDMPGFAWHPLVSKIVDVMCAADPENGSGVVGGHDHSHDPATGECYWAGQVGPQIAALFPDAPDRARIEEILDSWEAVATSLEGEESGPAEAIQRRVLRENAASIRKALVQ